MISISFPLRFKPSHSFLVSALLLAAIPARSQSQSWVIGPFIRPVSAPVIAPKADSMFSDPLSHTGVAWEALHTFNPAAAIAPDGRIAVIYRAEDASGEMRVGGHTSRLGLALSSDGVTFIRETTPVFFPQDDAEKSRETPGGTEDPRLVQTEDGLYVLTYTQNARVGHKHDVGVATSRDLRHWIKYGPIFAGVPSGVTDGQFDTLIYKSAGILTGLVKGRLVAIKLHGKYWMYWGEGTIYLATSGDLIHWTPVLDPSTGQPKPLLAARAGMFDSGFPEMGPPPVLTSRGIVVMYDAKNALANGALAASTTLAPGAYSVGEALFSADDPSQLLDRTAQPVFQPEKDYERSGQYVAGTTFAEGLVAWKGRLWMYYGCADSFVDVATAPLPAAQPRR